MWTIPLRMRWAKSSQAFGGRGCFVELVVCGNIAKVLENIPGGRWGLAPLHVPFLLLFHRHHTTAPHPQCPISLTIRWWPHHLFHQEDSIWAPQVPASINVPASPNIETHPMLSLRMCPISSRLCLHSRSHSCYLCRLPRPDYFLSTLAPSP